MRLAEVGANLDMVDKVRVARCVNFSLATRAAGYYVYILSLQRHVTLGPGKGSDRLLINRDFRCPAVVGSYPSYPSKQHLNRYL